jgi:hypothetical protein
MAVQSAPAADATLVRPGVASMAEVAGTANPKNPREKLVTGEP